MNTMARIAIGTFVIAAATTAAALLLLNVQDGAADTSATNKDDKVAPETAINARADRFEVAQTTVQPSANQAAALPGGASSLQETYQDWTVICAQQPATEGQPAAKRCSMSQQQASQKNGQRVLAIELRPSGTSYEGMLVLPFGLALDNGVIFQVDDGKPSGPSRFRTCIPGGCLVPLSFDAAFVATLQKGSALKIKTVADGGTETPFIISLKGLGAASARLTMLGR